MFSASAEYESFMGRWSRLIAPGYIAFAGVKSGERVLDVGAGTGSLGSALVERFPSNEVVGIDPSVEFIAHAQQQAKPGRTRYEVGDAQALPFPDASFDHAMALLVMNFIPDPSRAIAEMRRVTRPKGIVSACVWDYNEGMQMLRLFWDEAVDLDPAAQPRDERHTKLCRQGQLASLWNAAGLAEVQEEPLEVDLRFSSFEDYWIPFTKGVGPAGARVASLSGESKGQLEARLRRRLLGGGPDRPFVLRARAWCVRGEASGH